MNPAILDSAFIKAQRAGFIDGLVVIRNGRIVAEEYYNGFHKDFPHDVKSTSKSFLSALAGKAIEKGYIRGIENKVLAYFPEYTYLGMDRRKYDITIRHLLSMRMGIDSESKDDYKIFSDIYRSRNWIKTTIEYPLSFSPGERMRYNTFQTHLLSAIITRATGMSTLKFARRFLLTPMGIDIDYWERDPQGYYFGGTAMHFTPREMAVLGYLYLNKGRLNDLQIVPREWVEFTLSPSTSGGPNEWGAFKNYNYAYLWWLGQINEHDLFMSYGYGGQFVIVFPNLSLMVVSTARHWVDSETSTVQEWAIFDLVSRYILPSIFSNGGQIDRTARAKRNDRRKVYF